MMRSYATHNVRCRCVWRMWELLSGRTSTDVDVVTEVVVLKLRPLIDPRRFVIYQQ